MINITTKELEIESELKKKIEFICDFCNTKPTIINGNIRAEYGKEILLKLSKKLTNQFGSGFSRSGLQNMRLFYNKYKNCQHWIAN